MKEELSDMDRDTKPTYLDIEVRNAKVLKKLLQ